VNFQAILPHSNRGVQAEKGLYNLNCSSESNKSTQIKPVHVQIYDLEADEVCTHFKSFVSVGML